MPGIRRQWPALGQAIQSRRVRCGPHKICRSERVQARLREISKNIHANELTTLGRARIHQKLTSNEKNDKVMLGYIRTGAELEGGLGNHLIGDRGELHLHATLPPRVQQMLEEKMLELMGQRNAEAIDAEIVSQEEKQDGSAPTPTEPLAPTNTPDVNIPTDDALHRRQIVTGRRYIKAMHDFLGVGQ